MQVIKPVTYAESQLISTTATETLATWLVGTTYALGDKRQYGVRLYESLIASNLGNQPDTNPTKWLDYAPDNKHAMFDNQVNTQTTKATPLTVVTKPGIAFNSIAYLNISGSSLNVKIQDDAVALLDDAVAVALTSPPTRLVSETNPAKAPNNASALVLKVLGSALLGATGNVVIVVI